MNARILVIEDEPALRALIATLLEQAGHAVFVAEHGRLATTLVEQHAIGLVVTDLLMPEQDGIETIVQLRLRWPALPVLAITGGGRLDPGYYLRIAKSLGADAVLGKPFSGDELLARVAAMLAPGNTPGSAQAPTPETPRRSTRRSGE